MRWFKPGAGRRGLLPAALDDLDGFVNERRSGFAAMQANDTHLVNQLHFKPTARSSEHARIDLGLPEGSLGKDQSIDSGYCAFGNIIAASEIRPRPTVHDCDRRDRYQRVTYIATVSRIYCEAGAFKRTGVVRPLSGVSTTADFVALGTPSRPG